MIDTDEVYKRFEEFFKKMSYEERADYLKNMGFSFGTSECPQEPLRRRQSAIRVGAKISRPALVKCAKKGKKNGTSMVQTDIRIKSKA